MSRTKRNPNHLSGEKTRVDTFEQTLETYTKLRSELSRMSYNTPQDEAEELKRDLERLGQLSEKLEGMDRSTEQTNALKKAREEDSDGIKKLHVKLPGLIEAHKKQVETMEKHAEKERQRKQQAESVIPGLFKQINAAANDYLQAISRTVASESLKTFRELGKQLKDVLESLPKGEERTASFKELGSLSQKINAQSAKNKQLLLEMREKHQDLVTDNRNKVTQLVKKGGSLVAVLFLTAPKEVKRAVGQLIENKEVMVHLQNNEQLLELLGTDSVAEGLRQITSGNAEGAVVPISQQNQLAALETILGELSRNEDISSNDVALARQFLRTVVSMVKGAQELQRGEKQYATFVTEVDGFIKVMHVNLNDFLLDPSTVGRILSTFMEQGATQPLHMQLTSREQAAAISVVMNNVDPKALTGRMGSLSQEELLSLTQGSMSGALVKASTGELVTPVRTLADVTRLISQSRNVAVLAGVLGTASPELEQQLTQVMNGLTTHYANKPSTTFTEAQILRLIREFAVLSLTAQDIQRIINSPSENNAINRFVNSPLFTSKPENLLMIMDNSLANASGAMHLLLGRPPVPLQLTNGNTGPLPIEKIEPVDDIGPFIGASDSEGFEKEPQLPKKEKKAIDLEGHKQNFNVLLNNMAEIGQELAEKQEEHGEKYEAVLLQALNLYDMLEEQGKTFFSLEHPTRQQLHDFNGICTAAIVSVMPEFEKQRGGWWDDSGLLGKLLTVVKAILGVVAAITVVPAAVIEGTTRYGYVKTFFGKPETTESATKLAGVKAEFEQQADELDEAVEQHNKPNM